VVRLAHYGWRWRLLMRQRGDRGERKRIEFLHGEDRGDLDACCASAGTARL
jgi:hypothetical protein